MIGKLPALGFSLLTAVSSTALAHEDCDPPRGHAGHAGHAGYGGYAPAAPPVSEIGYSGRAEVDLRYADLDRNGWVTMQEARDSARQAFRYSDRNHDRVLSRHELGHRDMWRDDRDRDGLVTMREYQHALRDRFASLDSNRDGVLARYELGLEPRRATRSAGWWSSR